MSNREKITVPERLEGFTHWHGGECPVNGVANVDVIRRSGKREEKIAGIMVWAHGRSGIDDIIAYRVVREKITADTVLTDEMEIKLGDVWMVHRGAIGCKVSGFHDKTSVRYKDDPSSEFTYKPEQEKHPTCSNCGRTLIHVRPGKWQCGCELNSADRFSNSLVEEPELKIEAGKKYKTRSGQELLCKYTDGKHPKYPIAMETERGGIQYYGECGKYRSRSIEDMMDIISEWTDTPEPAPWQVWGNSEHKFIVTEMAQRGECYLVVTNLWRGKTHRIECVDNFKRHTTYLGQLDPADAMEAMLGTLKGALDEEA